MSALNLSRRRDLALRLVAASVAMATPVMLVPSADARPHHHHKKKQRHAKKHHKRHARDARLSVSITSPPNAATIAGSVKFAVSVPSSTRSVSFYVDGVRTHVDSSAPFTYGSTGYLDSTSLANGRHTLTIKATDSRGRTGSDSNRVYVDNPLTPAPAPAPAPAPLPEPTPAPAPAPSTSVTPPVISSVSVSGVTQSAATVNAAIDTRGQVTTAYVEYGTTTAYGNKTLAQSVGSTGVASFAQLIGGGNLSPATTYHFRITAVNGDGSVTTPDASVTTSDTTSAPAPTESTPTEPAPAPSPTPTPTPSPTPTGTPLWQSTFELGSFAEWTTWRRTDGGTFYVADAASEGIPPHGGSKVAHFEVTSAQESAGTTHSKLFKSWALGSPESGWHDDQGNLYDRLPNNNPAGTYSAWFYLPSNYTNNSRSWVNIFQFKESFTDSSGSWQQDPEWWLNMTNASAWPSSSWPSGVTSSTQPVIFANYNNNRWGYNPKLIAAPRGRWFELRAELYPGDRIEWYLDGQLFDTSRNSTYPVGVFHSNPSGWTFGIGHYGGVGKLWADDVTFIPR